MTYTMTETLKSNNLPTQVLDLNLKAELSRASREDRYPVINLKTGRTGKGEGCPCKCLYCDVNIGNDQAYWDNITELEFKNIISQWADQGGKIIHWCGDGEPSVFKYFDPLLDIAKEKGVRLELFTSLAGLTEERAEKLIGINAVIKFKMDSRNPTTMGKIISGCDIDEIATISGARLLDKINILIDARKKSENYQGQLVASIVMSQNNIEDISEVLEWCCQNGVIPQISYMEAIGAAVKTGIKALTEKEISDINHWLKIKYNLDPKQIMGDNCEAKSAPIIVGNKIYLGPFGMGCEFTLREHLGELNFIGGYRENIQEVSDSINRFRFSPKNIHAIIEELTKIRDLKGIYNQTGTDKILPGCGDDIEELWFLEYVATIFTSDKYFNNFVNKWILQGKHRKWTKDETQELINELSNFLIQNNNL